MSKLAVELPKVEFDDSPSRGPRGACYPLYKDCDEEDYQEVQRLRSAGYTWEQVQSAVDKILEIEASIPRKKFVYHWRQQCVCWKDAR